MTVQMNLVLHFVAHLKENGDLKPLIYDNICILHFKDQNTMHFENMIIKILHISKIHSKQNGYKKLHFSHSFNRNPTEMTRRGWSAPRLTRLVPFQDAFKGRRYYL